MSYKALINSKLRQAFNMVKDLAEDVTFNKVTVGDFDFATGTASTEVSTPVVTKAIIIKSFAP